MLCTRQADGRRIWRYLPLVLILYVWASTAFAQVPQATIERIAAINVEIREIGYLRQNQQLDNAAWGVRRDALGAELKTLQNQLRPFSADEQRQANSQIDGLIKARLAVLEPQWQKKTEDLKQQAKQHDQAVSNANNPSPSSVPKPDVSPKAVQGKATEGGTSAADYKRDVAQAGQFVRRLILRKTTTDPKVQKSYDEWNAEIVKLRNKWKTVGREDAFIDDYYTAATGRASPPKVKGGIPGRAPPTAATMTPPPNNEKATWSAWLFEKAAWVFENFLTIAIGAFAVFVGGLILLVIIGSRAKPAPPRSVSSVHGTAAFHPVTYAPVGHSWSGIFLGQSSTPQRNVPLSPAGAPVFTKPEHHTLIVAIVPTLLRYRGSALVIDPKGENAAITARPRREIFGQKVFVVNPWNELSETFGRGGFPSATYNPLDILDRNDPNAVAVAQAFAGAICPVAAEGKDHFWQGSAGNILTAVFLWLTDQPGEQKTLGRAREVVSLSRKDFTAKFLVPMAASEAFGGAIRENAAPFIDMAQETYSGVMAQLSEDTKFLSDPQIKAATATSSFSMNDLVQGNTTVYVVIPTDRIDTQKTWLRLVLAASMYTFKRVPVHSRAQQRCLFLIDEFAALGRLADFPRDIATMSGYGVDFALVIQGLDQLKDHYGEARGTILSNCAYKWLCNVGDLDTAKWLNETLGKMTVETESRSHSTSSAQQGSTSTSSVSHSETGRSLFNPDEILNLGKDVAIVLHAEGNPHYLKTIDYWNVGTAFADYAGQYTNIFWDPPLGYEANPYNRESSGSAGGRKAALLSPDEARTLLGIGPKATAAEIRAAHLRLRGQFSGVEESDPLVKGINAARDVLLGV